MRKEIGSGRERTVGWLLYGGMAFAVFSVGMLVICILTSAFPALSPELPLIGKLGNSLSLALSIIGIALGMLMMFFGLGYGIYTTKTEKYGPRHREANFRVLSRFCLDKTHQLLISDFDIEVADKPKFYVRGALEDGSVGEFETTLEVFYQAGEGMTGEAEVQGKWLGSFIPYIGSTPLSVEGSSTGWK